MTTIEERPVAVNDVLESASTPTLIVVGLLGVAVIVGGVLIERLARHSAALTAG
jgi:hypothetical protein